MLRQFSRTNAFYVIVVVFAAVLMYRLWFLIATLFLSFIFMAAFAPIVAGLKRRNVPNFLAVLIPYVGLLILTVGFILPLVPVIIDQFRLFIQNLPFFASSAAEFFAADVQGIDLGNFIRSQLSMGADAASAYIVELSGRTFGMIFALGSAFVISFYLLLDRERIKRVLAVFVTKHQQTELADFLDDAEHTLGSWLRGQMVISVAVGILVGFSLFAAGVPYASALGLLAAFLEFIPYLGPILAAIPAIAIALNTSFSLAILVVAIFLIIQFLENNVLEPQVMHRQVRLHPVISIIALLAGAELGGFLGAILAIPAASLIRVFARHVWKDLADHHGYQTPPAMTHALDKNKVLP